MAGYGYEEARALLVVVRAEEGDDAEYEEFLRRIDELDRGAFARNLQPAFILVTSSNTPPPNATWRRRIAEAASAARCERTFAGIVTDSAIQRGVLNALRWLQTNQKGASHAFATFEQACSAAERHRGEALPSLPRLFALAREDLMQRKAPRSRAAL